MNGSKRNFNRKNRARALWRWLALSLCLALLLGSVSVLAEENPPAEPPVEDQGGGDSEGNEGNEGNGGDDGNDEVVTNDPPANDPAPVEVDITWRVVDDGNVIDSRTTRINSDEVPTPPADFTSCQTDEFVYIDFVWPTTSAGADPRSYDATYTRNKRQYTITWVVGDDSTTNEVDYGETPSYPDSEPTKPGDDEYESYTLSWTPEIVPVTGTANYTAVFTGVGKKSYTITWNDSDNSPIDTTTVEYGQTPSHADPQKADTEDTRFTFSGWTPALDVVTGNQTYKANYTTQSIYTISWNNIDNQLIKTTKALAGTIPNYDGDTPTYGPDAQYTYTFAGWTPDPVAATISTNYTAKYNTTVNKYTVTWRNEANVAPEPNPLEVDADVPFGTAPSYDGAAPTKPTDDDNFYNFVGWADSAAPTTRIEPLPTVSGNTTYVAVYKPESRTVAMSPFTYKLSEDKATVTITGWDGTGMDANGMLALPEEITYDLKQVKVTAIADAAFQNKDNIKSLSVAPGLKTIGANAFEGCDALESLTLPDSLEALGENAMANCPNLKTLTLRCTGTATLNPSNTLTHTITKADNTTEDVTVTFAPIGVTDVRVTKNGVPENTATLTLGDFTVSEGHGIDVEAGATLVNAGTLTNFGYVNNAGTFTNSGSVLSCSETSSLTGVTGGTIKNPGDHDYDNGVCKVCSAKKPEPQAIKIKYTGKDITKEYDKTKNVKLSKDSFEIEDTHGLDLKIKSISASYDKADAGKRTVNVTVTLEGNDAGLYGKQKVSVPAKIEPKPLVITPTTGQKKTYGASDPKSYTGKVKGLLSGDKITGKLGRESGENVGKYRIIQGTIDAGANYDVQVVETYFNIEAKSINSSDVGLVTIGNQRYTGQKVEPEITLKYGKNTLKKGTDFKVEFTNNVQPGQATVKLTGIGNFTGTRETSFRILNIAGGGGSSSSGGGGGNYSYDGFDDGEGEDEDEEEDENVGHLIINGVDYGTILFNAEGIPAPFVQFEEPVEQALPEGEATDEASDEATGETVGETSGESEEVKPWTLTIIADPLVDEETGETLMLDDGEREQYDELHLRLSTKLIEALINLGCTEIIYTVDSAEIHLPLLSLLAEIPLQNAQTEVVGVTEGELEETEEIGDAEAVEEAVDELEVELGPTSLHVAAYDIRVEQTEVATLTQRESDALAPYAELTGSYLVYVTAVLADENGESPEALVTENADGEEVVQLPPAERLPAEAWPKNLVLHIMPNEELQTEEEEGVEGDDEDETDEAEEGATLTVPGALELFVSVVQDETVDPDVITTETAAFVDVDGMLYAQIAPAADGLYGIVCSPDDLPAAQDNGIDLDDEVPSALSTLGGTFKVDENGNPIVD